MPETKEIFDNCVKYYNSNESLGLYNFIGDLTVEIYDKALKQHNDKIISKFLTTYNNCINGFKGQFLFNKSLVCRVHLQVLPNPKSCH